MFVRLNRRNTCTHRRHVLCHCSCASVLLCLSCCCACFASSPTSHRRFNRMSTPPDAPSVVRGRSRSGADPRPPSPAGSDVSFASTASFRRKQRDRQPLLDKAALVKHSRFEYEDVNVDDAMSFLSKPHTTWDSAYHELARLESLRERMEDDARSNVSSVSAYSVTSRVSTTSRKGSLAMLPKSPPPPPDLMVGGSSVGGYSFVAPRTGSSVSTATSIRSQRVGEGPLVGPASGKSGVRAMPTRGPSKAQEQGCHPSSAPGGQRRPDGGTKEAPSFQVSGQFMPRLAPKRGK
jgi:hypothetical protein